MAVNKHKILDFQDALPNPLDLLDLRLLKYKATDQHLFHRHLHKFFQ